MDVTGVGPGAASGPSGASGATARQAALPKNLTAPGANMVAADSVATLLRELTQIDLTRLLAMIENPTTPGREEQVSDLLRSAVSAVAEQNPAAALGHLRELIRLEPSRAEALLSEPELASIRTAVEQLVSQLTSAAKLNAENRLAAASHRVESAVPHQLSAGDMNPDSLVMIAAKFIEIGGIVNYLRSAAVSGVLIDDTRWAPAFHAEPVSGGTPTASQIPLRLLLLTWFVVGMLGALICWWSQYDRLEAVFAVWAGGLLVLACVAGWQRVGRGKTRPGE